VLACLKLLCLCTIGQRDPSYSPVANEPRITPLFEFQQIAQNLTELSETSATMEPRSHVVEARALSYLKQDCDLVGLEKAIGAGGPGRL
jgi:hypothetical protein